MAKTKEINFFRVGEPYGFFCNFYMSTIIVDGKMYRSVEHYYQSRKPTDRRVRQRIIDSRDGLRAFRIGHTLGKEEIRPDWDSIKVKVMKKALKAKFSQNPHLREMLLETGNATLHENSPWDMYWGIKGKDMLGKLLMELRSELRKKQ